MSGKRTEKHCRAVVEEVKARTGDRSDLLLTSDEHAPYESAIKATYGVATPVPKKPGPGRRPNPTKIVPVTMCYATVRKTRQKGRVIQIVHTLVFGLAHVLAELLGRSVVSSTINTSFVERHNGTDRGQNARKTRKTYRFSKTVDA